METNYVLFIDGAESMASLDQERGVPYMGGPDITILRVITFL